MPATGPGDIEVVEGRDGFLFMRGDSNRVLDQHAGVLVPGEGWQRSWADLLAARRDALDRAGIPWVGLVAPDREAAYPEMLPPGIEPAERRPIHAFLEAAEAARAPVHYPLDAIRREKPGGPTYSLSDTHWNGRGAYAACCEYARHLAAIGIAVALPQSDAIEWRRLNVEGDLGSKLTPPEARRTTIGRVSDPASTLRSDNLIANHGRLIRFERPSSPALPRAVLFGESFSYGLLPFLRECFSALTFAHTSAFDMGLVRRERCDVVLWSPVERFLIDVPNDRLAGPRLAAQRLRKRVRGSRAEAGGNFLGG